MEWEVGAASPVAKDDVLTLAGSAPYLGANSVVYKRSPNWVTTFDPTIDQAGSLSHSVNISEWRYDGPMVEWNASFTLSTFGGAGTGVTVTLPVATKTATTTTIGVGMVYDSSSTIRYVCQVENGSTTTLGFGYNGPNYWGSSPSIALANNDVLRFSVRYRWA